MHGVAQAVGEGPDARAAELSLGGLLEERVVGDLPEVPALAVEVDRRAVDPVLLEGQGVETGAHGEHGVAGVVAHEVEAEAVDLVVPRPRDDGVDHEPLGHRVLGRDVLAARRGLDGPCRAEALVVAGDHAVEHRLLGLAARRGVVEHLVEDHLEVARVQASDHGAELGDACPAVLVALGRVRPLGCREVQRVVAPVEGVGARDSTDSSLLLGRVGGEAAEVACGLLQGAVFFDRGDVEGRQQVHGVEPCGRERPQVLHAVGVTGEGLVGPALCLGDGLVGDREVAHVQLVDAAVDIALDHRLRGVGPERRLVGRVREVDEDGLRGVERERDGRGVCHDVVLDGARRVDVDLDVVDVRGVLP